jgi:hypothetical protein
VASIRYVNCDAADQQQRLLKPRHERQRLLGDDGVVKLTVAETISKRKNRFSVVKSISATWVGERRPD